jgi:uncharacterized low-complexity protein
MSKSSLKPVVTALGAAFLASAVTPLASASNLSNPFTANALESGYDLGNYGKHKQNAEGKCGEGRCGGSADKAAKEGQCGGDKAAKEGQCGGDKAAKEGKCGAKAAGKAAKEGQCGGNKPAKDKAAKEGKCGEGRCGGSN